MKVLDPGHSYKLDLLDLNIHGRSPVIVDFVKREGDKYPGNIGSYAGTNTQELCRVIIDRAIYLDNQEHHPCNQRVVWLARQIIMEYEARAAERHGRIPCLPEIIELEPTCKFCGHIGCNETCGGSK